MLSLASDQFHSILKESIISILLKKRTYSRQRPTLKLPANLQPVSPISKIIERVVNCRLTY